MSQINLDGFLCDAHCPSESNLEVEIDCSNIGWDQYRDLLLQLGDILTTIDEAHSVKSWSVRGRSVRSRYKRVTQEDRRRRIRFSPFPSSFSNTLTNTRAHVYEVMHQFCIVLEQVGNKKLYLLPKAVAPDFMVVVEALNEDVVDKLNKSIVDFTGTKDYLSVEQSLHSHGVDPSILRTSSYAIGQFRADVIPINMGYSVDTDQYYAERNKDQASKGLDLLKQQVDTKFKERSEGAMKDLVTRVSAMADEFDKANNARYVRTKFDKLIQLCLGLGMNDLVDKLLKPVRQICNADRRVRKTLMLEQFGTESLRIATQNYLKSCQQQHSYT